MKKLSALVSAGLAAVLVLTLWGNAPTAVAGPATSTVAPTAAPAASGTAAGTTSGAAAKKGRYKAPTGPYFNNPRGGIGAKTAIERKILEVLRHVPKKGKVKIALYSFDRINVANAIIAAHKRGVQIQMLLNDHQDTKAMKMVRGALGANRKAKSFLYKCHYSCRGPAKDDRNLHSKFFTFSQAGKSQDVVIVGSHNFTRNATHHQWNDMYFLNGDAALYDNFNAIFDDMKKDYEKQQPAIRFCGTPVGAQCDDAVDQYAGWAFPRASGPTNDLVLDMLNKVQCVYTDATGAQKRTKLALSMHTMRGNRGDYLATAIRQKYAEGCDFRVDYGLIGYKTKQVIGASTPRGRIPLRSTGFDYDTEDNFDLNNDGEDDLILDRYTHQKYFVIDGMFAGDPNTKMVLTGSSNWASLGTAQDEIWFTVRSAGAVKRYTRNFDFMWRPGNSRNAYTTTYTNFRVPVRTLGADGEMVTTYRTERRKVTTVEPDRVKAGGRYWEGD